MVFNTHTATIQSSSVAFLLRRVCVLRAAIYAPLERINVSFTLMTTNYLIIFIAMLSHAVALSVVTV